ncbi:MAG TPA: hypothetical protein VN176_12650 [Verrucomicrobiae bacterium]|jgi:hypothetical protein|nr:hypothetical protein [Verrucomicrobiae bacterium]
MKLLKTLHFVVRMVLVMACAFWAVTLCAVLPSLISEGLDGLHGKLSHLWMMGRFTLPWTCTDSLQIIHEGYTDLLLMLLATWGALELKRFLRRRMMALAANAASAAVS